jgi:large subunit ribosomal protein L24
VILADPERQRVLVHGVNMVRKNKKVDYQGQRGAKEGGIMTTEAPIHVSNVQLIDPDSKKPARAGYRFDDDGAKVRVARPGGKDI